VSVESWTLDRYREGQLAESRVIMDVAGMLMQLGVVPPLPPDPVQPASPSTSGDRFMCLPSYSLV